jgi:hypothetical protein
VVIVRMMAMEELIRRVVIAWPTRSPIQSVSSSVEGLRPERRGHVGVKKKSAYAVIQSAKNALRAANLL